MIRKRNQQCKYDNFEIIIQINKSDHIQKFSDNREIV